MPVNASPFCGQWRQVRLPHYLMRGYCAVACLLASISMAHAHGDDEPPSRQAIALGIFFMVFTVAFLGVMCLRSLRRTGYRPPRHSNRMRRTKNVPPEKMSGKSHKYFARIKSAFLRLRTPKG